MSFVYNFSVITQHIIVGRQPDVPPQQAEDEAGPTAAGRDQAPLRQERPHLDRWFQLGVYKSVYA